MININIVPPTVELEKPLVDTSPSPSPSPTRFVNVQRRDEALLAFEAEFDTWANGNEQWGYQDQFFLHDGCFYFYKPHIELLLTHTETPPEFTQIYSDYDPTLHLRSIDDIRSFIQKGAKGLPDFICETPQFFQFSSMGASLITSSMMSRDLLNKIRSTFDGGYTLRPLTKSPRYYINQDQIYCADLSGWVPNSDHELHDIGVLLDESDAFKVFLYNSEDALTDAQKTIIYTFIGDNKPIQLINL